MFNVAFIVSLALHVFVAIVCISGGLFRFSPKKSDPSFTVFEFQQIDTTSHAPKLSDKDWHASKDIAQKSIKNTAEQEVKTTEKKEKKSQKDQQNIKQKIDGKVKKISAKQDKNKEKKLKKNDKDLVDLRKNKKSSDNASKNAKKKGFDSLVKTSVAKKSAENTGINAEKEGEVLSATQIDLIRQTIRKCWHYHANLSDANALSVNIRLELNSNGKIIKADIIDKSRMSDPSYRMAAENALRAVRDPRCNTLPLPKKYYKDWKIIELNFDPND